MNPVPKFSIITINLNNREGLITTISSVIRQKYDNYEYLVIDGASTDGSLELIEQYAEQIDYWVSEPDKGVYFAMNKGIEAATGDFICFLNSGDEFVASEVLSSVNQYIRKHEAVSLFFGNCVHWDIEKSEARYIDYSSINNLYDLRLNGFAHPATFYKKELFNKIGLFNSDRRIVSDLEWNFKALVAYKTSFIHFPIPIAIFYSGGLSTNSQNIDLLRSERQNLFSLYYSPLEDFFFKNRIMRKFMNYPIFKSIVSKLFKWSLNKVNL